MKYLHTMEDPCQDKSSNDTRYNLFINILPHVSIHPLHSTTQSFFCPYKIETFGTAVKIRPSNLCSCWSTGRF